AEGCGRAARRRRRAGGRGRRLGRRVPVPDPARPGRARAGDRPLRPAAAPFRRHAPRGAVGLVRELSGLARDATPAPGPRRASPLRGERPHDGAAPPGRVLRGARAALGQRPAPLRPRGLAGEHGRAVARAGGRDRRGERRLRRPPRRARGRVLARVRARGSPHDPDRRLRLRARRRRRGVLQPRLLPPDPLRRGGRSRGDRVRARLVPRQGLPRLRAVPALLRRAAGSRLPQRARAVGAALERERVRLVGGPARGLRPARPERVGARDRARRGGDRGMTDVLSVPREAWDDGARAVRLSGAQRRLWFLHQLAPESLEYVEAFAFRLRGEVDPRALERALLVVVARHEALRTRFDLVDGEPVQLIEEPPPELLRYVDLRGAEPEQRESRARELVDGELHRPFDLTRAPLLRAILVRLGDEESVLGMALHHITFDAWSIGVLGDDLEVL